MKKITYLNFLNGLLLLLLLSACSNDPEPVPGSFDINGRSFGLNKGYLIINEADTTQGREFGIALTSSGINVDPNTTDFSGSGNFVLLSLRSPEGGFPSTGNYDFGEEINAGLFTFYNAGLGGEFDFDSNTGRVAGLIVGGSVGIQVEGNNYTIRLSLAVVDAISGNFNAINVEGNYQGTLENINF